MYVTGTVAASRAALAGLRTCIRSASAVNEGCPSVKRTTSPSSSASPTCSARLSSSGYAVVISTPERA